MKKRVLAFVLAICLVVSHLPMRSHAAEVEKLENSGKSISRTNNFLADIDAPVEGAIPVSTAEELAGIQSGNYVLTNDIDLSSFNGGEWIPIVPEGNIEIDGQGHVISNLAVSESKYDFSGNIGLIGRMDSYDVTLKNIGVEDVDLPAGGALVGYYLNDGGETNTGSESYEVYRATTKLVIDNCYVLGSVGPYDGGLLIGEIYNSSSDNDRGLNNYTRRAYTSVEINSCFVSGNVSDRCAGGLIGSCSSISNSNSADWGNLDLKITDCISEVTLKGGQCGGMVGKFDYYNAGCSCIFSNCISRAQTSGGKFLGGMVGYDFHFPLTFIDCVSNCDITSQDYDPKLGAFLGYGSHCSITFLGENFYDGIDLITNEATIVNPENVKPMSDVPQNPSNPEITTSVRFLSGFDPLSRRVTFGDSELVSPYTYTVAEGIDVSQFLNRYVLVSQEQVGSSLEYFITDIQAVDSKIGTVTNTETVGLYLTSMTIDGIKYSVPGEKYFGFSSLIDNKVLYHVYSGQVVGFEEIQYKTGRLDKYNQSANRVTIDGQEYATNYIMDWSFIDRFDELEGKRVGYYIGNLLEGQTSQPFLFEIIDSNESSYIKLYATDDDLTVATHDSFDVICTLVRDDQTAIQWHKPAVVVGNTDVISLSNYLLDSKGYHFTVTGLKEGTSSLIVSDSDTGANITASITVSEEDIVPYSYRVDKIPEFYPNVTGDKKTKTNFYDLNGMYVKDYVATENKTNGSWDVSFKVYNHRYMYGAVDIYDENGNWKDSEMIAKYTEIGGIYETGEAAFWLLADGVTGNMLSYTAHTWSKCTPITINVPKGGYFTISNNYLLSPGAYLFNTMDLLVWSASTIVSKGLDLSKSEEVLKKAKEELTVGALVRNEYIKKLQSIGTKVAKNIGQDSAIANQLCSLENIGEEVFKQTLDWKAIFKNTTSLGEEALEKLMGPIGETIKILFDFSSYLSYGAQTINLGQSINKQYVTIFTPQNSGSMSVNGVTVTPSQEAIDSDTVLQVFRISTNDRIVILDKEIVADQYELYNICFVKDDKEVQPNGQVTVRVPVPNGFDGKHCTVYRQESDGTWSVLSARVDGDYLVFETDHFSMYVIAQTNIPTSTPTPTSKPTSNPTPLPTSTPQPTNSPTPDATPTPQPWANPFPDVSDTAWYIKAVEYVAVEGLMHGYPNGKFGPNDNISRAEFAQIIYNKAGRPDAGSSMFTDVKNGEWYTNAVTWAAEQKVVSGIGNNRFAPKRDITREELATMLWRYAGSPDSVKTTLSFTDASKVSNFAKKAMLWANENRIVSGKGNGILDPKGKATRAETAQMLMNYLKK